MNTWLLTYDNNKILVNYALFLNKLVYMKAERTTNGNLKLFTAMCRSLKRESVSEMDFFLRE